MDGGTSCPPNAVLGHAASTTLTGTSLSAFSLVRSLLYHVHIWHSSCLYIYAFFLALIHRYSVAGWFISSITAIKTKIHSARSSLVDTHPSTNRGRPDLTTLNEPPSQYCSPPPWMIAHKYKYRWHAGTRTFRYTAIFGLTYIKHAGTQLPTTKAWWVWRQPVTGNVRWAIFDAFSYIAVICEPISNAARINFWKVLNYDWVKLFKFETFLLFCSFLLNRLQPSWVRYWFAWNQQYSKWNAE